jgi:hypothetical protein
MWDRQTGESVFHSAVKNKEGEVDPGYLAVFWTLVAWSIHNIVILGLATWAMIKLGTGVDAGAIIQNTGIALGANATGFGVVIGAVGLFRAGDSRIPVVAPIAPIAPIAPVAAVAPVAPIAPVAAVVPVVVN